VPAAARDVFTPVPQRHVIDEVNVFELVNAVVEAETKAFVCVCDGSCLLIGVQSQKGALDTANFFTSYPCLVKQLFVFRLVQTMVMYICLQCPF